jgi:hypothetical protein
MVAQLAEVLTEASESALQRVLECSGVGAVAIERSCDTAIAGRACASHDSRTKVKRVGTEKDIASMKLLQSYEVAKGKDEGAQGGGAASNCQVHWAATVSPSGTKHQENLAENEKSFFYGIRLISGCYDVARCGGGVGAGGGGAWLVSLTRESFGVDGRQGRAGFPPASAPHDEHLHRHRTMRICFLGSVLVTALLPAASENRSEPDRVPGMLQE